MKTCFFIGHRDAPETLLPLLEEAVERHITEYGAVDYVVGHYGRFDALAAHAVREAKQRHPETRLTLLILWLSTICSGRSTIPCAGISSLKMWSARSSA